MQKILQAPTLMTLLFVPHIVAAATVHVPGDQTTIQAAVKFPRRECGLYRTLMPD